ncbi:MAG: aldehyde dehydrogenase [Phototrophicales bacterium]|nr:MAG: aldehyde dehydrogenase [Phototrophicales bacterium]RMG71227.1 MAG: aldehyde dehydrogenase family protein [Chloroflexota bacterium]
MMQIINPFTDDVIDTVPDCTPDDVRDVIGKAVAVKSKMANLTAFRRGQILNLAAAMIETHADDIAQTLAMESGKPMRYAKGEVSRAVETFAFASDEARRLHGETVPLDAAKSGAGKIGYYIREPVGVVAAITPFNFPLNLVAHKVAPAIAAGCPIVLKPAPATPLTALKLMAILQEAGLPDDAFQVVVGGADVGHALVSDPRISMISFTGSPPVARQISKVAGLRRVAFELGGNAATIIDEYTDPLAAVNSTIIGSFAYSGQVCISVQRIYIHQTHFEAFKDAFVEKANKLKLGDPLLESTDIGPMISEAAAARVESWVDEAAEQGADVIAGGKRQGKMVQPTVLINTYPAMKVMAEEVFGPVVCLIPFTRFEDALEQVNDSPYGLQAGVFTDNLHRAMQAVRVLNVGGVMINDVPTFRVDHMPYGGNKDSGVGREGPRFAIEDMTTLKMVVINAKT